MINVEVYILSQRVDLFKDENITLNLSIKNLRSIDKVLGDFTQGFTIPASPSNNAILQHWYDKTVTTSFNPATKLSARIELNGLPYKRGVVSIDKAVIKNGKIDFYEITFFGSNTGLKQLFGEDYINELDLSAYEVDFTNFPTGFTTTLSSGNVFIPLISPARNWQYNDDNDPDSIKYVDTASTAIKYVELKPAIRLQAILAAIEAKYSVTFNSTFFDSSDFSKLYMWAHREAGNTTTFAGDFEDLIPDGAGNPLPAAADFYDNTNDWFYYASTNPAPTLTFFLNLNPYGDDENIPVEIIVYDLNNSNAIIDRRILPSTDIFLEPYVFNRPSSGQMNFRWAFRCSSFKEFLADIIFPAGAGQINWDIASLYPNILNFQFTDTTTTDAITGESRLNKGNLPNQTVTEFMSGLTKMFNLVIEPVSETEFNIEPLDDYYSAGSTIDFGKWIDNDKYEIRPASLFGEIDFKYFKTETILGAQFRESNDLAYGDLRSVITDTNGDPLSSQKINIELPFTNLLWERLTDQTNSNSLTTIVVGKHINKELKPIVEQPLIFYRVGAEVITGTPIALRESEDSNAITRTSYNLAYQFNTKTTGFTGSLNWGSEINPYTLQDGTASTPSLYNDYWKNYIEGLYASAQRQYVFDGVLPLSLIIDLRLNSPLVIGFNTYRINAMKVDLTTGKSKLELINIIA